MTTKPLLTAVLLSALALPGLVQAQTPAQTSPQSSAPVQDPAAAAATLPNAFAPPGSAAARAPAAVPVVPVAVTPPDLDPRALPALTGLIEAMAGGKPDYAVYSEPLAAAIREREAEYIRLMHDFGSIVTVLPIGRQDGADLFRIIFENADTQWVIGLFDDGKIGALQFRPTPTETDAPTE